MDKLSQLLSNYSVHTNGTQNAAVELYDFQNPIRDKNNISVRNLNMSLTSRQ